MYDCVRAQHEPGSLGLGGGVGYEWYCNNPLSWEGNIFNAHSGSEEHFQSAVALSLHALAT